ESKRSALTVRTRLNQPCLCRATGHRRDRLHRYEQPHVGRNVEEPSCYSGTGVGDANDAEPVGTAASRSPDEAAFRVVDNAWDAFSLRRIAGFFNPALERRLEAFTETETEHAIRSRT